MLKTTASYALVAALSATAGAVTVKELISTQPGIVYRAHHMELDSDLLPDGGLAIRARSYLTASNILLPDGGRGTADLSTSGNCPLTATALTAAKTLLNHGKTVACGAPK